MKIFTATLGTETNTFAPLPTNLESFQDLARLSAEQVQDLAKLGGSGSIRALLDLRHERGVDPVFGMAAYAQPGGLTTTATYETLRDELLDDLAKACPVDGVLLHMHGAMAARGYDDCEGDILMRARQLIGPDTPLGAVLDPHCHLSETMVEQADVIVCYKEYPHTDVDERCVDGARLVADMVENKVTPVHSVFDCRMIAFFHTTEEPMQSFVSKIKDIEANDPKVLSISVVHGFGWGDVEAMGSKILVVTDNAKDHGDAMARALGMELFAIRNAASDKMLTVEAAVDAAIDAASTAKNTPVVIADASDNPGGGAPADSTHLIRALMDRGVKNAAAAFIWDPNAVAIAHRAGEGTTLEMRIGGKTSRLCGDPLDLTVTVKKILDDTQEHFASVDWHTGPIACVDADGFELVLITKRVQCFTPAAFENVGIDPRQKDLLVVKSSQHFYTAFAPIAGTVLYADPPGVVSGDLPALTFEKIQRPKWPFDAEPFADAPPR